MFWLLQAHTEDYKEIITQFTLDWLKKNGGNPLK